MHFFACRQASLPYRCGSSSRPCRVRAGDGGHFIFRSGFLAHLCLSVVVSSHQKSFPRVIADTKVARYAGPTDKDAVRGCELQEKRVPV